MGGTTYGGGFVRREELPREGSGERQTNGPESNYFIPPNN